MTIITHIVKNATFMWNVGYDWAAEHFYIDANGWKNVNGGLLGKFLSTMGNGSCVVAEGVRYFLSK